MIKKIIFSLLTAAFIFVITEPISAATLNASGQSASAQVRYNVDNTAFVVDIPAIIDAGESETSFRITAQSMNLKPQQSVEVRIAKGCDENGKVVLTRQGDTSKNINTLTTTLFVKGKNIADNDMMVAQFKDSDTATENLCGDVVLSALSVNKDTRAGEYIGNLEFVLQLKG